MHAKSRSDLRDTSQQIDELLGRLRILVFDLDLLERAGADELQVSAVRRAITRLQERLAELVQWQYRDATPPAA
jgi:post-segregation antitoxin (ccd killing protein)